MQIIVYLLILCFFHPSLGIIVGLVLAIYFGGFNLVIFVGIVICVLLAKELLKFKTQNAIKKLRQSIKTTYFPAIFILICIFIIYMLLNSVDKHKVALEAQNKLIGCPDMLVATMKKKGRTDAEMQSICKTLAEE